MMKWHSIKMETPSPSQQHKFSHRSHVVVLLPEGHTSLIGAPTLPTLSNYFHCSRMKFPIVKLYVTLHWRIAVSALILLSHCQGFLPLWPRSCLNPLQRLQLVVFGSCCWSDYRLCAGVWLFATSLSVGLRKNKICFVVSVLFKMSFKM